MTTFLEFTHECSLQQRIYTLVKVNNDRQCCWMSESQLLQITLFVCLLFVVFICFAHSLVLTSVDLWHPQAAQLMKQITTFPIMGLDENYGKPLHASRVKPVSPYGLQSFR